jgi:hypothetical protein
MKEWSILPVLETIIEFVFPDNSSRPLQVYHAKVPRILMVISAEDQCALETGIRPAIRVGMGIVYSTEGCREDLVGSSRDRRLDFRFVVAGQNRLSRHDGGKGEEYRRAAARTATMG